MTLIRNLFWSAKQFRLARRTALVVGGPLLVVTAIAAASILSNSLVAHFLWSRSYINAAYYTNYTDAPLALQEGFYYFGGGKYDLPKAVESFTLATKLDPGILWGHYQLARIYFVQGRLSDALVEINLELTENPANLRSLYERGLIETALGNFSAAEADFKRFINWAPHEWGGYNDGAFVLAKEGKYEESAALIEQAFENVPNGGEVPWLWNSLGLAQLNALHYAQAEYSFKKALALTQTLTEQEWVAAYTANDPAAAAGSIAAFRAAIQKNINTAQAAQTLLN